MQYTDVPALVEQYHRVVLRAAIGHIANGLSVVPGWKDWRDDTLSKVSVLEYRAIATLWRKFHKWNLFYELDRYGYVGPRLAYPNRMRKQLHSLCEKLRTGPVSFKDVDRRFELAKRTVEAIRHELGLPINQDILVAAAGRITTGYFLRIGATTLCSSLLSLNSSPPAEMESSRQRTVQIMQFDTSLREKLAAVRDEPLFEAVLDDPEKVSMPELILVMLAGHASHTMKDIADFSGRVAMHEFLKQGSNHMQSVRAADRTRDQTFELLAHKLDELLSPYSWAWQE